MKKITFVILLVGLFFLIGASYISEDNRGVEGFLDLSGYEFDNDQIINLDGEWEFYWKELLEPEDFKVGKRGRVNYLDLQLHGIITIIMEKNCLVMAMLPLD